MISAFATFFAGVLQTLARLGPMIMGYLAGARGAKLNAAEDNLDEIKDSLDAVNRSRSDDDHRNRLRDLYRGDS